MIHPNYEPLWRWVRGREDLRVRRARGEPPPWTTDPILASYRFCNVRREDDKVTIWIRRHVREVYQDHPLLWLMLCLCRMINWPDTLAELIDAGAWPGDARGSPEAVQRVLHARKARGDKVYTGAYVIPAPAQAGADKATYVADVVVGDLWRRSSQFAAWFEGVRAPTLQGTHERIRQSPGWGDFLAYQAVVDLRFCPALLAFAPDRETWAAAGPGSLRGLHRLYERALVATISQAQALEEIRAIFEVAERETGVAMDFSDVPNILCETDKYLRVALGQGKPRARYRAVADPASGSSSETDGSVAAVDGAP